MNIGKLYSILLKDKPSMGLRKHEEELFELIPELRVCKDFNQHNEWHPYDVLEHTYHVVDNVPNDLSLRLTALFHDVGKPICYKEDENGIGHFYGHWVESMIIFNKFSKKYNLGTKDSELISHLIYYHDINVDKMNEIEKNMMHSKLGLHGIKMLYQLKKADLLAQNEKYHYILDELDKEKEKELAKYK